MSPAPDPSNWAPAIIHFNYLHGGDSGLHGPAKAITDMWGVNQQVEALSPFLSYK